MEKGFVVPGALVLASDSHTPSGGALGALAIGTGETELGFVWATGRTWLKVPETIRVVITGKLAPGVAAKDVVLTVVKQLGVLGAGYKVIEYQGQAVSSLSVSERFTFCNMSAEVGAKSGIFPADEVTEAFVHGRARFPYAGFPTLTPFTQARSSWIWRRSSRWWSCRGAKIAAFRLAKPPEGRSIRCSLVPAPMRG